VAGEAVAPADSRNLVRGLHGLESVRHGAEPTDSWHPACLGRPLF